MNRLNKIVMIFSKVIEVILLICSAISIGFSIIIGLTSETKLLKGLGNAPKISDVSLVSLQHPKPALMIALIVVACILICAALILRNIYLIFKTTIKKQSPFVKENVKHIKDNAFIMIGIVALELLGSLLINNMAGTQIFKCTIDIGQLFFILIVLCLSQFFAYGVSLEEEVEGLV